MFTDTRVVRPVALLAGGLVMLAAGCSSVQWEHSYKAGMERAVQRRQRAVVMFATTISPDCLEMDGKVFSDSEVQGLMKEYVAIRLDPILNKELAQRFNVTLVPTFLIIRPDVVYPEGVPVTMRAGKMDATKFKYFLIKYRRS